MATTLLQTEAFLPLTATLPRPKAHDSPFQTSPSPPSVLIKSNGGHEPLPLLPPPSIPLNASIPSDHPPSRPHHTRTLSTHTTRTSCDSTHPTCDSPSHPISETCSPTPEYTPGALRALALLNTIPDRFNEFCAMDQCTFIALADWILENAESSTAEEDISVEESLFVFLDFVARGSSVGEVASGWGKRRGLVGSIFLNILNALLTLHAREPLSPDCPPLSAMKSRWRIVRHLTPPSSRKTAKRACKTSPWGGGPTGNGGGGWGAPSLGASSDTGRIRVGDDDEGGGGGITVDRMSLTEALMALNNFIWMCRDL